MTPGSQPSDRLRGILERARKQSEETRMKRDAVSRHAPEASAEDLVARGTAVPDAHALARLYQDPELVDHLPEATDDSGVAGRRRTPTQAGGTQPTMSMAEVREVVKELQQKSGPATYRTFEAPRDEAVVAEAAVVEAEPEADASRSGPEWAFVFGAVAVLLAVLVLVFLAANGPLHYRGPVPGTSPVPSISR